jgi:hypothetical protein
MTYYVEAEMLGDSATNAAARRMVELLQERGVDAALGSPLQYDHDPDECPDAVWEQCLDVIGIEATVRAFTVAFIQSRGWQLGQTIPGLDAAIVEAAPPPALAGDLQPQDWLQMALYGAGLVDADPGEMRDVCQSLAEWLFAVPGESAYAIPDAWTASPMGALWWAALVRAEGDALVTVAEAARLAGVSVKTLSKRIDRGALRAYVDPSAPARQGRRLVRRSDVAP